MNSVLVTGASGFIGQHLVTELLVSGQHKIRGTRQSEPEYSFFNFEAIEWRTVELSNRLSITGLCDDMDIVVHLAAIARQEFDKSWDDYLRINVEATENLLDDAEKAGVKRFVYISTVEAAGFGNGTDPRVETDLPSPVNFYGKSKLAAEKIVLSHSGSMETVVLRLPMVYGPGSLLTVPKLFGMVNKGIYPLIGTGTNLMEFCYVGNIVTAICLALTQPNIKNELFYVSDCRSYSIREVISAIAKAENKKVMMIALPIPVAYSIALLWEIMAKIIPIPPIISKISRKPFFSREAVWWTTRNVNIVSTAKIRGVLGYRPFYSIDDGCKATVDWLKSEGVI